MREIFAAAPGIEVAGDRVVIDDDDPYAGTGHGRPP
jgi:hypothetical protein